MGIDNGNEICSNLRETSTIKSDAQFMNKKTNLYIDGPILAYCANLSSLYNNTSSHIPSDFALRNILNAKLMSIVSTLKRHFDIQLITIVFDGQNRMTKHLRRPQSKELGAFNVTYIRDHVIDKLFSCRDIPITLVNLVCGEAETEMYLRRDVTVQSVLYTKDTDIYGISYNHQPTTENDLVFVCFDVGKHTCETGFQIYQMDLFKYKYLHTHLFRLLVAFTKTDYTHTMMSKTQLLCLMDIFKDTSDLHYIETILRALVGNKHPILSSPELDYGHIYALYKSANKIDRMTPDIVAEVFAAFTCVVNKAKHTSHRQVVGPRIKLNVDDNAIIIANLVNYWKYGIFDIDYPVEPVINLLDTCVGETNSNIHVN